jgi:O-antigen/teichoic acid export membrane protein
MKAILKGSAILMLMSFITQMGSLLLLPFYSARITPEMFGILGS